MGLAGRMLRKVLGAIVLLVGSLMTLFTPLVLFKRQDEVAFGRWYAWKHALIAEPEPHELMRRDWATNPPAVLAIQQLGHSRWLRLPLAQGRGTEVMLDDQPPRPSSLRPNLHVETDEGVIIDLSRDRVQVRNLEKLDWGNAEVEDVLLPLSAQP